MGWEPVRRVLQQVQGSDPRRERNGQGASPPMDHRVAAAPLRFSRPCAECYGAAAVCGTRHCKAACLWGNAVQGGPVQRVNRGEGVFEVVGDPPQRGIQPADTISPTQ